VRNNKGEESRQQAEAGPMTTLNRLLLLVPLFLLLVASSASAAEPAANWVIYSRAFPTNLSAANNEQTVEDGLGTFIPGYDLAIKNAGAVATNGSPVTITDDLPEGISPITGRSSAGVEAEDLGPGFLGVVGSIHQQHPVVLPCEQHLHSIKCVDDGTLGPGDVIYVKIRVHISPGLEEGEHLVSTATVSGGGAAPVSNSISTLISSKPAPFGMEQTSFEATSPDGLPDTQAGDHPYEFTTTFYLNTAFNPEPAEARAYRSPEDVRDVITELPAGFVGNPQVVEKCSQNDAQAKERVGSCPAASQVGVVRLYLFGQGGEMEKEDTVLPIYNVVPAKGVIAQFVFDAGGDPVTLRVVANQETNYALRVIVSGIPRISALTGVSLTFFGEPATNHDVYNEVVGASSFAFLQNPVDCDAGPQQAKFSIDSWQHPGSYLSNGSPNLSDPNWKTYTSTVYQSITGCDMLQFEPSIAITPSTTQADEPTGVNVSLRVPQTDRLGVLATPELDDATVTLPAGMSVSPSAADGLAACGDAQIDLASIEPGSCPDASVLGTVKVDVPLLETPLEGQVFLGEPECGVGGVCTAADAAEGRMLRLYIEVSGSGVLLKKEGRVYLNPSTGQLTAKFEDNPQAPFENFELTFKSGLRAGLATPQTCGTATTTTELVPWSSPITPDASPSSSFDVSSDGQGGACPSVAPLTPAFSAGTSNPNAGQFSPFTLTFGREDREQDLSDIQVRMPPGLLGSLSGIPLCGEAQANAGTCAAASRIGTMTVAAGPGSHPFYEQGSIYLTEHYDGAPFGLSIVVPTVAGPFNLGNVVVRARIEIDPLTAALTVTSNPFPQVIDGIPLRLRTANVTIDRPGFIFNPTNCEQLHVAATVAGAQGAQARVSTPFAVSGCAGLHFGPTFKAYTQAKTSRADGASLDVKLSFPAGAQSNIAKVKVDLPKTLPSRLTTLQKACTAAQFNANAAGCPAASVVGIARASTPVLPVGLTGPAYFVSNGGEAFPNLIVVLQGYGVRIDLVGDTFISKAGITSSTFENVPDVQVSSFELYLPEGKYSALTANGNLCKQKLVMPTLFTAQDGAQLKQNTKLTVTGCPTTRQKTKQARRARKARKAMNTRRARVGNARRSEHASIAGRAH
jgi:hypothetical protein